jgi:hypothetical protein
MGTTEIASQIVCPFCGYEGEANDFPQLVRPVHNREQHPPIVRCKKGCKMLFAVLDIDKQPDV